MRRARLAAVAAALTLLPAAPAAAGTYRVTGLGDGTGSCAPSGTPGESLCSTLRAAVEEAGTSPDATDIVLVPTGTYQLAQGTLELEGDLELRGGGARGTRIIGDGDSTVFYVPDIVTAGIEGVTIEAGVAPLVDGGNIYNRGRLTLDKVRVTGGVAAYGGGIANEGNSRSTRA